MEKLLTLGKYASAIAVICTLLALGYNALSEHFAQKARDEALYSFFEAHSAYIDSKRDLKDAKSAEPDQETERLVRILADRHGIK